MQIVVVLSPAEGMGRTTVASMLTAGLLAREHPPCVLALDAAATETGGDFLAWARRQRRNLVDEDRDTLTPRKALDVGELLGELDLAMTGRKPYNGHIPDFAVIDTPARMDARAHVALRAADIVLVPVRSRAGEDEATAALDPVLPVWLPAFRVACGYGPSEPTDAGHPADAKPQGRRRAPRGLAMTQMGFDIPHDPRFVGMVSRGCPIDDMARMPGWAVAEALAEHAITELAQKRDPRSHGPFHRLMIPPAIGRP